MEGAAPSRLRATSVSSIPLCDIETTFVDECHLNHPYGGRDDIRAAGGSLAPLPSRRFSDLHARREAPHPARPEPRHPHQVADRPVRAAGLAFLDDPARADRADARQPLEIVCVRRVEVDAVIGPLRRRHRGRRRPPQAAPAIETAHREAPQDRRAEQDEDGRARRRVAQPAAGGERERGERKGGGDVDGCPHAYKVRRGSSAPPPGSADTVPSLPVPRGPLSHALLDALARDPHRVRAPDTPIPADPLADEDLQLSLYLCYELHYRGLPGVADEWEWEPSLLALRRELEASFEAGLRARVPVPPPPAAPEEMDLALRAVAEGAGGPSLSRYIEREATLEQVMEVLVHRSAYQLKEAEPHSWALPRLYGAPKAALVEIQADEYGNGSAERIHAQLFADAMDELGLDARYGAYVDRLPGVTLATVNLMSFFGLHRRWRGAIVGHLALFETESSLPNRRYGDGLRRLGATPRATEFFDEHVAADAIHEQIAAVDLAGGLARQQPQLADDILWGAAALVELDARLARHMLGAWSAGARSLRAAGSAALEAGRGWPSGDRARRRWARGSARACGSRRRTG